MVSSIEQYARAHPDRIELFARVPGHASLVTVRDAASWPESYDTTYNLWRDSAGHPIKYVASPFVESGDESIEISYWFDPDGRTILYEYYAGSFNSECTDVLRETRRIWLNRHGAPIASTMRYTDRDAKPVHPEKCDRQADSVPAPRLRAADLVYPPRSAM